DCGSGRDLDSFPKMDPRVQILRQMTFRTDTARLVPPKSGDEGARRLPPFASRIRGESCSDMAERIAAAWHAPHYARFSSAASQRMHERRRERPFRRITPVPRELGQSTPSSSAP